ncbi:MAG: response regulator [Bacillota bacterium]
MKVLLADDHTIVRQGLRSLLEKKTRVNVVGEAVNGREAIDLARKCKPDLVIMDIAMPGLNGLEALSQIKKEYPLLKAIILSMHVEENYVNRALRCGASAFIYKGSAFDDLELAMDAVQANQTFLSPAVSKVLLNGVTDIKEEPSPQCRLDQLSPREREVMQMTAEGCSRHEIAETLSISVKTVDRHKENLKKKLKIQREDNIADLARSFGLIDNFDSNN